MRLVARRAVTATVVALDPGELDISRRLTAAAPGPGLLILRGGLVRYARVCDRVSAELLGGGDLIQPRDDPAEDRDEFLCSELTCRAILSSQIALLDAAFAERIRPWPQIADALLRRAQRRARDLALTRAITAQPRLDLRLFLMLWHLAPRWGRVEPGGIQLPLPLTHQLLGRLVGAERPSVTHALKRLAVAGALEAREDGWRLLGTFEEHLSMLEERVDEPLRPRAGGELA